MTTDKNETLSLDIPYAEYQAIEAASFSRMVGLLETPLTAKWRLDHPEFDTDTFRKGRAIHCAALEPQEFAKRFAVWSNETSDATADEFGLKHQTPGKNGAPVRNGKVWDHFADKHSGRVILTSEQATDVQIAAARIIEHPSTTGLIDDLRHVERSIVWTNARGIRCKGRLDAVTQGWGIVDIKSTNDPNPYRFKHAATRYGYLMQGAMYCDGLWHALGCPGNEYPSYHIIALQSVPPYDVVTYRLTPEAMAVGETQYEKASALWVECQQSGVWPGHSDSVVDFFPPSWALAESDDFYDGDL